MSYTKPKLSKYFFNKRILILLLIVFIEAFLTFDELNHNLSIPELVTDNLQFIQFSLLVYIICFSIYTAVYLYKKYKKEKAEYEFIDKINNSLEELNPDEYVELLHIYKMGKVQLAQESVIIEKLKKYHLIIESSNANRYSAVENKIIKEVSYVINYDIKDIIKDYFKGEI